MKRLLAAAFSLVALFAGACSGGSPAGVYDLDKERLEADLLAVKREGGPTPAEIDQQVSAMSLTIDLAADGTAKINSKIGGLGADSTATGTWKVDGNKVTLTMKHPGSGQEEINTGEYADGVIMISMGTLRMHFRRR